VSDLMDLKIKLNKLLKWLILESWSIYYLIFVSRVFEKINGRYLSLDVLLWALETV